MRARQIVLIMTDTQRTDMLGCYGHPASHTPALDRLAAAGLRCDRAYTCQPVCGPARAALFTGTYPHSNGSWANSLPLGDNVKTIGQRLQDAGWHTAYIGKWHLDGGDYFGMGRCPDGWDPAYWYDERCYLDELTPAERQRSRQMPAQQPAPVAAEFTYGHRVAERAVRCLEAHGTEDLLLVVSFDEPHHPYLCPPPFAGMHQGCQWPLHPNASDPLTDKPTHQRVWAGPRLATTPAPLAPDAYLDCNAFVDSQIGRVLAAIDQHAPGALVIYTADHGDHLGAHRLDNKGAAMYDEITRIPLLLRWPGVIAPGSITMQPVSHIDVVPTLLAAAGEPVPALLEGHSLVPLLRDPAQRVNDAVFIEFGRYEVDHDGFGGFQPIRCICDGRYKLVINLLTSDEFYDLASDPGELHNRLTDADLVATRDALHNQLLNWMNRTRDPFRGYYWERRPWRLDAGPATWAHTGMTRQREHEEYEPRQLDYATGLEITQAVRPK